MPMLTNAPLQADCRLNDFSRKITTRFVMQQYVGLSNHSLFFYNTSVFRIFAYYTCFRTSISQILFHILYVVRFRTFTFSHFAFYTCPSAPGRSAPRLRPPQRRSTPGYWSFRPWCWVVPPRCNVGLIKLSKVQFNWVGLKATGRCRTATGNLQKSKRCHRTLRKP